MDRRRLRDAASAYARVAAAAGSTPPQNNGSPPPPPRRRLRLGRLHIGSPPHARRRRRVLKPTPRLGSPKMSKGSKPASKMG
ncbi:hypothetical protein U9M48_029262 [Paspalum notatum var. saurae]|uniref:Uncharacterized protein n=1 Tax=Paspalum notatum var. saurae TaxID=547442 RepID=A0AAQ3U0K8_PASNO